jgi:hypothetical protein
MAKDTLPIDVKDYVLIKKSLLDNWAQTVTELNKTLLWLRDERERLINENDEYERIAKEMDVAAKKLMAMFKDIKAENERLTDALVDRMPKIKPGAAS